MQKMSRKVRLDRQPLRQELFVKLLSGLLAHEHTSTTIVLRWSTSTTHHLQYVHDRVVDVTMFLSFVILNTHDDDHVTRNRETPRSVLRKNTSISHEIWLTRKIHALEATNT